VRGSRLPAGFGFPLGFLAATLATTAAVAGGATARPVLALVLLAAVVTAIAAISTSTAAVATAAVSWALHAGFVLGRHGDLALTPPALRDAITLGTAALLAALLATLIRALCRSARTPTATIPIPRTAAEALPRLTFCGLVRLSDEQYVDHVRLAPGSTSFGVM